MRAVTEKPRDAVLKFDIYRNLQWHRAVVPATARLLFCELLGCEWNNFLSQNKRTHRTVGT